MKHDHNGHSHYSKMPSGSIWMIKSPLNVKLKQKLRECTFKLRLQVQNSTLQKLPSYIFVTDNDFSKVLKRDEEVTEVVIA